jgi:hypothetical protein
MTPVDIGLPVIGEERRLVLDTRTSLLDAHEVMDDLPQLVHHIGLGRRDRLWS